MKHVGHLAQQVPRAPAHQHNVASLGRLAACFPQAVQILLIGRMQAEPVGHAHSLFVQPVQFGIRHVLDLGSLMKQFAVEHFPAEGLSEAIGHLTAPGAVLASDGNGFHRSGSQYNKKPHQEYRSPGGAWLIIRVSPTKKNHQGRGHQQRFLPLHFKANPIAARILPAP